jgi:hypothetical protein
MHMRTSLHALLRTGIVTGVVVIAASHGGSAYVGDAFLRLPGVTGDRAGGPYKNWIVTTAHYWNRESGTRLSRRAGRLGSGGAAFFAAPNVPRNGAGVLNFSVDKHSAVLKPLMDRCTSGASIADASLAVSSDLSREGFELGPRPAKIPEYFEFTLKDVVLTRCPVVADAPEQAFVLSFKDIKWTNYQGEGEPVALVRTDLTPAKPSPTTRSYVLTWFANANWAKEDQCKSLMPKPTEDDYYALMSKEDAAKERAQRGDKGVGFVNEEITFRGPDKLNACQLPGIVKNPGTWAPVSSVARGLNLDGDDGSAPPPGVRAHKNYMSEYGDKGIDNQYYTAAGCVAGYQGEKGFMMQFVNNQMHDGLMAMLVQITGVDNEQNDDSVDLTIFYTHDPMQKNATGSAIAPDYTFRVTDELEYAAYFRRLHGRIVNGVLKTDPVEMFQANLSTYGTPSELTLARASVELRFTPEGGIKGVIGGYLDWRKFARGGGSGEQYFNYSCPGLYNALKNAADGLQDPVSGQFNGLSSAWYLEGIPAFIAPAAPKVTKAGESSPAKAN